MDLSNPAFINAVMHGKSRSQNGLNKPELMAYARHYNVLKGKSNPSRADLVEMLKPLIGKRKPTSKPKPTKARARSRTPRVKVVKPHSFKATVDNCISRFTELDSVINDAVILGKTKYGDNYVAIAGMLKNMLLRKEKGQLSIYESSKGRIKRCIKAINASKLKKIEKDHIVGVLNKLQRTIRIVVEGSDSDGGSAMFDLMSNLQSIASLPEAPTYDVVPAHILNMPDAPTGEVRFNTGAGAGAGAGARRRVAVAVPIRRR